MHAMRINRKAHPLCRCACLRMLTLFRYADHHVVLVANGPAVITLFDAVGKARPVLAGLWREVGQIALGAAHPLVELECCAEIIARVVLAQFVLGDATAIGKSPAAIVGLDLDGFAFGSSM